MNSINIQIDPEIRQRCPALQLGCLRMEVKVEPSSSALEAMIDERAAALAASLPLEKISSLEKVRSSREAYKALGKKPGRYRPSAEALLRRVVSGKGLYRINNVVDLLNFISIDTGYSIGGYDAGAIIPPVTLGIGREGEPYQAVGRGELNIGRLPVLRDQLGAFGSPTSDSERTMVREETGDFLLVFFNFGAHPELEALGRETISLFTQFCHARHSRFWII